MPLLSIAGLKGHPDNSGVLNSAFDDALRFDILYPDQFTRSAIRERFALHSDFNARGFRQNNDTFASSYQSGSAEMRGCDDAATWDCLLQYLADNFIHCGEIALLQKRQVIFDSFEIGGLDDGSPGEIISTDENSADELNADGDIEFPGLMVRAADADTGIARQPAAWRHKGLQFFAAPVQAQTGVKFARTDLKLARSVPTLMLEK